MFFKTDTATQKDYTSRGMVPFTYESKGKVMTMTYHEVPPEILEQPLELVDWARRSIHLAAKPKKVKKARP